MSSIKQAVDYAFDGKISEMGDEINNALMQKVADMIMGKRQEVAQSLVTGVTEEGCDADDFQDSDEEEEEEEPPRKSSRPKKGWVSSNELGSSLKKEDFELVDESEMSSEQKDREKKLKAKFDSSDMKKNMMDQYGKEKGEQVYFAKIRKMAMEEVEDLDEVSKKTLSGYIKKNVEDTMYKNWDDIPKNRKEGLKTASEKLRKKETNEDVIDEMITRRTLQSYKKPDRYLARQKKRIRKYPV